MLNVEQRRAHDIIEQHLRRTLAGAPQEQLLMIVRGEGGTGKTVLLNAIADTFDFLQASALLAKTATTGVAASLVGGVTVHSWASIPINAEDSPRWTDRSAPATMEKRKRRILPAKYVNIDECSMLTKRLLAQLSQ
ncbi:DNA helicase Pif1 like protein, partial [Mycena vitilis]